MPTKSTPDQAVVKGHVPAVIVDLDQFSLKGKTAQSATDQAIVNEILEVVAGEHIGLCVSNALGRGR